MNLKLFDILKRPALFERSPFSLWNDDYISAQMLNAHLAPKSDGASRRHDFIDRSAGWIASLAAPVAGKRLLDLGCGPGLYTERFHKSGFAVYGIDISRRSIEYARTQTSKEISYQCGSYIEEKFPDGIDIATMIYCDFGVLSSADRQLILCKTAKCLNPGGIFVFDVFSPFEYSGRKETTSFTRASGGFWSPDEYVCFDARIHYPEDRTYLRQVAILTANELRYYNIWEHVFTRRELRTALTKAGFSEVRFYADVAGSADFRRSKTICAVAKMR